VRERFDDIIREYIDFVNEQVGTYMDALAGFAGHYSRVERQVHRICRPVSRRKKNEETVIVAPAMKTPENQTPFLTTLFALTSTSKQIPQADQTSSVMRVQ
jgi:hypothetical protein